MTALVRGEFLGYVPVGAGPVAVPREPQKWFILQSHPNAEGKVTRVLEREGISFYYPTVPETRRITRRRAGCDSEVRRTVKVPLFLNVIFIPDFAVDDVRLLHERLSGIDGVSGFLRFGTWVAWLKPELLADVRTLERFSNIAPSRRKRLFAQGEEIRIVDGPFRGFNGIVDRLDSKGRLVILVNLLGRLSSVAMTEARVEKI
jgi:transcriptional antiterminator NusG